jgi:CRISPR-associated protein Csb2
MSGRICLSFTFVDPYYHGRVTEEGQPEWPPSPYRVFCALVNVAHRHGWCDTDSQALRWLETLPPPEIVAPNARPLSPLLTFVPSNNAVITRKRGGDDEVDEDEDDDEDDEAGKRQKEEAENKKKKLIQAQEIPPDTQVHFSWTIDDSPESRKHASWICERVRLVGHLGHARDFVFGDGRVLDDTSYATVQGDRWTSDGTLGDIRVPAPGTLDGLDRLYELKTRARGPKAFERVDVHPTALRRLDYRREVDPRPRRVHAFQIMDVGNEQPTSFYQAQAGKLAARLRHAAIQASERLGVPEALVRRYVAGHGDTPSERGHRLSYVPIPSVRHRYVDGRVRRAMIVEPPGPSENVAEDIVRNMPFRPLLDVKDGSEVAWLRRTYDDSMIGHYVSRARRWASVTPVILHGHADKGAKRERMFVTMLSQSGYRTPGTFSLQERPAQAGCLDAREYFVPEHLRAFWRTHAVVEFNEPVSGPLLVGLGRYQGIGLFVPLD